MNNISEQLLQAVDIVTDEKLRQLKYDKTVQAIIYSIIDEDTGEYRVKYNGNIFSAFAEEIERKYKVKDAVFVKIPEGDFSGKKIITSLVTSKSLTSSEQTDLANTIFEVSPSFDEMYGKDFSNKQGVIAGVKPDQPMGYQNIYIYEDSFTAHNLFQQYSNNYEFIRLKASFLTTLQNLHNKGNYGLEIGFYTVGEDVKYRLDIENFNGNPYAFSTYTPQEIVLQTQKGYLKGLKYVKLFQEEFDYDVIITGVNESTGEPVTEINKTLPNIFVKDIQLNFVEVKDLSDTSYYLTISAPKGNIFTEKEVSLTFIGKLLYQGENISSTNKCTFQWYERDLSMRIGIEGYDKSAGFGWKKMDNQTSNTFFLNKSDVNYQQRYKLIAVYKDSVILSAEIEVKNSTAQYDYYIEQDTEDDKIYLNLKETNEKKLKGDWYLSYPDSSYEHLEDKVSQIEISSKLIYNIVIFYCAVYDGDKFIGTIEYTLKNSDSSEDLIISYVGEDTFRYDANGDIAIEDAEKERTLQVSLTWREGYGTVYSVNWFIKDSNNQEYQITSTRYKPYNSMIENIWVDEFNILHYNIKQKYKINLNNNYVIVKITTLAGDIYSFTKEILCLKDGDQGTNGTTYIAAIRPCDSSGQKLSGFNPLRYNDGWQSTPMQLRCYVYKDGELINNNLNYNFEYTWTKPDILKLENKISQDRAEVNGIAAISASSSSNEIGYYAKVWVKITDNIDKTSVNIYTFYPIDVIVGSALIKDFDIGSIPSYIKYNSSGLQPTFYSNNINFYYKNISYNETISSLDIGLVNIRDIENKKYLKPASNFISEYQSKSKNIAVLKMNTPDGSTLFHPIILFLNTYGNEAINGWDGTALYTGSDADGKKQYVFAPQIGAGIKESDNTFTGIVMGKDSGQDKVGLYGYNNGNNTFGLRDDGTAFFGLGGMIQIDGSSATINGGKGGDDTNGMTIILANLKNSPITEAIKVGKGAFQVNYDGSMIATKANITGNITANSGSIGGWTIEENKLYSGVGSRYVGLSSQSVTDNGIAFEYAIWAGNKEPVNANFSVKKDGTVNITKNLSIGKKIGDNDIRALTIDKDGNLFINSGTISIGKDENNNYKFQVDSSGNITANSGSIGGWTINTIQSSMLGEEKIYKAIYSKGTQLLEGGYIISGNHNIMGSFPGKGTEENFGLQSKAPTNKFTGSIIISTDSEDNKGKYCNIALYSKRDVYITSTEEGTLYFKGFKAIEGLTSTIAVFG